MLPFSSALTKDLELYVTLNKLISHVPYIDGDQIRISRPQGLPLLYIAGKNLL